MKRNHVWIVEVFQDAVYKRPRWEPMWNQFDYRRTEARKRLKRLMEAQPSFEFRLRKYTAEQSAGKG